MRPIHSEAPRRSERIKNQARRSWEPLSPRASRQPLQPALPHPVCTTTQSRPWRPAASTSSSSTGEPSRGHSLLSGSSSSQQRYATYAGAAAAAGGWRKLNPGGNSSPCDTSTCRPCPPPDRCRRLAGRRVGKFTSTKTAPMPNTSLHASTASVLTRNNNCKCQCEYLDLNEKTCKFGCHSCLCTPDFYLSLIADKGEMEDYRPHS